ncbi:MAG: HipA N-terminal domain-containing protein [Flavobacteriales bacterium]|nr:HipA N-terminal domain-containing protein [Flavobacteriales bacterium]
MRQARVLFKDEEAGLLTQNDNGSYVFKYNDDWFVNKDKSSISLTLPKLIQEYKSEIFFPFFYNMLPEGTNKLRLCKSMKIDVDDYFGLLINIAQIDTIGAIRVIKI